MTYRPAHNRQPDFAGGTRTTVLTHLLQVTQQMSAEDSLAFSIAAKYGEIVTVWSHRKMF
jgi:hypothetical protein